MDSQTKNRKTRSEIAGMVQRAFAGIGLASGADAVRELKDGWFNAAYEVTLADGRRVILKIAPPAQADVMRYERDIMATEVTAMRLVASHPGVPVPAILFHDDSLSVCDAPCFFMEKIEGDSLEHVHAELSPPVRATVEREVGAIIRAVNSFSGSYFGYPGAPALRASTWHEAFLLIMESVLEDAAAKQVPLECSYDDIRALLRRHAPVLEEVRQPVLVHWDAWNGNFFVRNGHISGIIDFERALWGDPLMEAQFRSAPVSGTTDAMRGYGKTGFTASELRRCWLYALHLALVMHVECYFRHYDTDSVFNDSRAMLARSIAWLRQSSAAGPFPRRETGRGQRPASLRPVQACAGRLGAAGLSPLGGQRTTRSE